MRTKKTLLNSLASLGAYGLLLFISLATRSLFLQNFDPRILGYAGTIENMFSLLSVAEMGVGSVITYRLYDKLAQRDMAQVSKFMSLYKVAYRLIGSVLLAAAALLSFCLPLIIVEPDVDWLQIYVIYGLQLASVLSSYFLAFRRVLYTTDQRGYICVKIDLFFNVLVNVSRILICMWWPNYILYFSITVVCNIAANLIIALRYKKDYPEVHSVHVTWEDFKSLGIFHDLKTYLVHRISNALYGGIDSIVITRMLGTMSTTLQSNYNTLQVKITDIVNRVLDGFASGIGNLVYDAEARERTRQIFWGLDLLSYFLGSFVAVAYFCLFQPAITLWLGKAWLLPMSFVFFFSLNEYVGWNHRMLGSFRAVLGHFEDDMGNMVASALLNVFLSFALVRVMGIGGVVAATVVAHCIMWFGRVRVVFTRLFPGGLGHYLRAQLLRAAVLAGLMLLTSRLCALLPSGSLLGFAGQIALVGILPNAINAALFLPGKDAAYLRARLAELPALVQKKLREKGEKGT